MIDRDNYYNPDLRVADVLGVFVDYVNGRYVSLTWWLRRHHLLRPLARPAVRNGVLHRYDLSANFSTLMSQELPMWKRLQRRDLDPGKLV